MIRLIHGDAVKALRSLPAQSCDAVITDPPYPCIGRHYGKLTEKQWWSLMEGMLGQARRILKPQGSAAFVLQANCERAGVTRPWLWEFVARAAREWNLVQDLYWWNVSALPGGLSMRKVGLCRPSVKHIVWLGPPDCYRNQEAVLLPAKEIARAAKQAERAGKRMSHPSGWSTNSEAMARSVEERGGATPFNLIPISNTDSLQGSGAAGHGAGTPLGLCRWLVRYLTPPGGAIVDPFCGAGTVGLAAIEHEASYLGIEKDRDSLDIALARCERHVELAPMFRRGSPITIEQQATNDDEKGTA